MKYFAIVVGVIFSNSLLACASMADELNVPAATAYVEPNETNVRVHERGGVIEWKGDTQHIVWFGKFSSAGEIQASVNVKLAQGAETKLRLTVGETSREASAKASGTEPIKLNFGTFPIKESGYHRFQLESLNGEADNGQIESLQLVGDIIDTAHFNLDPRRNAASVHLAYPLPRETKVMRFYTEVTAVTDPTHSFYMACGFHRGYFGMQVNSPTERRIIFSIWDAGNGANANARDEVAKSNRVELLEKGPAVHANDFGGEGTGGHSHLTFDWKTGVPQKFLVEAQPENKDTIFSGYYFRPDNQQWMLIARMRAPKDGGYLRGLHSFSENFWGSNGQTQRKSLFGNQWVQSPNGQWTELTKASFSHDPTGKENRLDRFMGVEEEQFFLSHGGFVDGFTKFGELFERSARGHSPDIKGIEQLIDKPKP